MSFKLVFSGDLLHARNANNWTQRFVADIISISPREYQNIEGGKCVPGAETFLKLVFLLELDVDRYRELRVLYKVLCKSNTSQKLTINIGNAELYCAF